MISSALLCAALLAAPSGSEPRIALVVMITIDQLGASYLHRYEDLLPEGGLRKLIKRGAYYPRAQYLYSNTETGPGHATIATGAWPNVHGIAGNLWRDESGKEINCVSDPEFGKSPHFLEVPNLADTLGVDTRGRSKIVSIAIKDRAAILLGGQAPTLVVWYDEKIGRFVSGHWPSHPKTPTWLIAAALEVGPQAAHGKPWVRLNDDPDFYERNAGPDDLPTEADVPGLGHTFPRTMGQGVAPTDPSWFDGYRGSPAAIEDLYALVERAVVEERLGQDAHTDLLAIGVSPLDYAGHQWGTHSQEALDLLLRIDRAIARLMTSIERSAGGRVLWVVTADHGSMPTPEEAAKHGARTRRISGRAITAVADLAAQDPKQGARTLDLNSPRLFLSPTDPKVDRLALRRRVALAVAQAPGVVEAYAVDDLDRMPEPFGALYRRSYFKGRTGDVVIRHRAYDLIDEVGPDGIGVGTGHGSPYGYDMTVPLIIAGPGVRPGRDPRPVTMTQVAPTIAALIGIEAPAAAFDPPLPAIDP